MKENQTADAPQAAAPVTGGKIMKWGMMACCIAMVTPIALYFIVDGTVGGLSDSLSLVAPLILCVGGRTLTLRAVRDLSKLLDLQGERNQAADKLAATLSKFTEGFETKDLCVARALLRSLS